MLPIEEIIRTAHREHEGEGGGVDDYVNRISGELDGNIPRLTKLTKPLSLVSFECLLQDTGYPMEVYHPGDVEEEVDWSKLKERWVGWGVEIPGEQDWVGGGDKGEASLPTCVHAKFPLRERKGDYIGALIKVYDEVTFKPASTHRFIGILSQAPMPSNDPESAELVPTIHVLKIGEKGEGEFQDVREELVDYLATAFEPADRVAGEFLLLALLSSPTSRPAMMTPIGTLSVNFRRKSEVVTDKLRDVVKSVMPRVVNLPLSIDLLHSQPFAPASTDSSSLDAGLLQLAEGTVLVVEEDAMGGGGQLNEKAVKNLKALAGCMTEQKLAYEYPYMEGLKMDCAIRVVVLSQGKSLLPVDVDLPVEGSDEINAPKSLEPLRRYLARLSSAEHAAKLEIPDDTAEVIQDTFVKERKENADSAEETLKRRMKVARLLALSHPEARLGRDIWERTVALDNIITKRS